MFQGCRVCCAVVGLVPILCCILIVGVAIFIYTNAPDPPISDNFDPSDQQAQAFQDKFDVVSNRQNVNYDGTFVLQFTEEELSSWLALESERFSEENDKPFSLENVQVGLDNGEATFYAEITRARLDLPIEVVIGIDVDSDGKMAFDIEKARVGGLRVPQATLRDVTDEVNNSMVEPFEGLGNYTLNENSLVVEDGEFYVAGRVY